MMLRILYALLLGWVVAPAASAQTFAIDYRRAIQAGDTAKTRKILAAWQLKEPQNPDWYVAKFNYLLRKSYRVVVSTASPVGKGVALQQKEKAAGSLNEGYEPQLLEAARTTLREGITLAPERLDMRFGLAKSYELTHEAAAEVAVLRDALVARKASGKPWRWQEGKALPKPEAVFVPENLESYMLPYWQADTREAGEIVRQLAELVNEYYPESSLGPFNLGMYYAMAQQPEKGYGLLQQANVRRPNDWQTLANLARLAMDLNRKNDAERYLTSLQKLPEGRAAAAELNKEVRKMK